jgi:signal transduction histidine kinase
LAFARAVLLACHDLRTPLATVSGFAKTLARAEGLDERRATFAALIDAAAGEIAGLAEDLSLLAEIEGGRYEPKLVEADTLDLATSTDDFVAAKGTGATIQTDARAVRRALEGLAVAAARHGGGSVTWTVRGGELVLEPVHAAAAAVMATTEPRDFRAIAAWRVIEALGGSLELDGETFRVSL